MCSFYCIRLALETQTYKLVPFKYGLGIDHNFVCESFRYTLNTNNHNADFDDCCSSSLLNIMIFCIISLVINITGNYPSFEINLNF